MIDTLKLRLLDYEVRGAKLDLQPAKIDTETGTLKGNFPLYCDGGRWIEGTQATFFDGVVYVAIKPEPRSDGVGVGTACYVNCELPKVVGDNNYQPADKAATESALATIQETLKSRGILTNIYNAQISRIDTCKNIITSERYLNYTPALAGLSGSRMKKRGYENGYLWENGRQEICVYDKREKMKHDKLSIVGLPANIVRFEHRAKQAAKVRDDFEFHIVKDMTSNFDHIPVVYRKVMQKNIFSHSVADVESMQSGQLKDEMLLYYNTGARNWWQHYLSAVALRGLQEKADLDVIIGALDEVDEDKDRRSRLKKKLRSISLDEKFKAMSAGSSRTVGELYQELQDKVLSV